MHKYTYNYVQNFTSIFSITTTNILKMTECVKIYNSKHTIGCRVLEHFTQ